MRSLSNGAAVLVFVTQLLTHFVYYPKYAQSGTEAYLSWDVAG